jgi:hypothetical protein
VTEKVSIIKPGVAEKGSFSFNNTDAVSHSLNTTVYVEVYK